MRTAGHAAHREPWNKGKTVGQKAPLKLKDIWALPAQRRRRLRQGYLGHRSLAPLQAGWLNDRFQTDTVRSVSTDD